MLCCGCGKNISRVSSGECALHVSPRTGPHTNGRGFGLRAFADARWRQHAYVTPLQATMRRHTKQTLERNHLQKNSCSDSRANSIPHSFTSLRLARPSRILRKIGSAWLCRWRQILFRTITNIGQATLWCDSSTNSLASFSMLVLFTMPGPWVFGVDCIYCRSQELKLFI